MSDTLRLRVVGVPWGGWESTVKRALLALHGVEGVTTSTQASLVGVAFDPRRTTAEAIEGAIGALGYRTDRVS